MSMLAVAERSQERLWDEPTLATVVGALWEELQAGRPVACPICHGEIAPQEAPHGQPLTGRCQDCGAALS